MLSLLIMHTDYATHANEDTAVQNKTTVKNSCPVKLSPLGTFNCGIKYMTDILVHMNHKKLLSWNATDTQTQTILIYGKVQTKTLAL